MKLIRGRLSAYFESQESDHELLELVRAADKICDYIKSLEEISTGNAGFVQAGKALRATIEEIPRSAISWTPSWQASASPSTGSSRIRPRRAR